MLAYPGRDGLLVAPGDQGVDQPVAARCRDVVGREAVAQPVVDVVGQPEVDRGVLAGDGARRLEEEARRTYVARVAA